MTRQNRLITYSYSLMQDAYGKQHWWPAETRFEVMVGAVLTQNTSWTNVERAIANLKSAQQLDATSICSLPDTQLAELIRPSGYFNIKSRRLKNYCSWYLDAGEYEKLKRWHTGRLREALLGVNGVGPETADDILLYAFDRKIFVVDAYTKRIFSRIGALQGKEGYEDVRAVFERVMQQYSVKDFSEYHALVVMHAKQACGTKPRCDDCCLQTICSYYAESRRPSLPRR